MQNYRGQLVLRFGNEGYLIRLRFFLKTWHSLGYPGVHRDVYEVLTGMSLKNSEVGRAVRSMDPEKGPLNATELHAFVKDIQSAYERGDLELEHFSVCLLLSATGRRPIQCANLKCKDLDNGRPGNLMASEFHTDSPKDRAANLLLMHVPRVKQYGATFRDEFRSIQWSSEFFALFRMLQHKTQSGFEDLLGAYGWNLQSQELSEILANLPLFPDKECIVETLDSLAPLLRDDRHGEALHALHAAAVGAQWHRTGGSVREMLHVAVKISGSVSRTGESLKINGQRLRYTKGTNLAREAVGRDTIAWLLDHSSVELVHVYTDNLPEHAIPANAAMALSPTMCNLAQLFRGQLVDGEEDALAGNDSRSSRIHFKDKGTATCGTRKQCGMGNRIPLCCYECEHFQPWLNGPHTEILAELLEERREREDTLGLDHPITKVADSTIVAVINVIQRCEVRRQQLTGSGRNNPIAKEKSEAKEPRG
ncbi:site-specific integrase [Polaromonas sp.]|uniref:site-specific integrase n=1 Tax=Polaromonas sp. TaxID=1869339 RepID=UPI003267DDE8